MKRYYPGITDKRLNNRRFYRTEEAILKAFFEDKCINIDKLTRRAGVARSTFYHHHRALSRIAIDYQKYIFDKYKRTIGKLLNSQKSSARTIYGKTLLFVIQYKKIFRILWAGKEYGVFENMVGRIRPQLITIMRLPKNSDKLFLVYTGEVVALIDNWCKDGMKEDKINQLLDEIVFLTETARVRLKTLL